MELELSLGDASKPFSAFIDKSSDRHRSSTSRGLGFCMALSIGPTPSAGVAVAVTNDEADRPKSNEDHDNPPLELELLPNTAVPRYPHALPSDNGSSEGGSSRGLDVNRVPAAEEVSSPNSAASSFQMERASSRASDEEENGNTRKKLRLSKEQSAFLEESFKEHNTLNPKQKLALAKQLNLRPRQVEVWFQNRRARTKLKQTEVDCEYLKRCCETLREENRRLHKELQELRALKASNPFHMQHPATTLTMCPSCERVATNTNAPEPRFYHTKNHTQTHT